MEHLELKKHVYGRSTYTRVIDTSFSELYTATSASSQSTTISVEQFFDYYDSIFFSIPTSGTVNSHEYLIKRSTEYLGGTTITDREQAYIDEINSLRQQLLQANANYLNSDKLI